MLINSNARLSTHRRSVNDMRFGWQSKIGLVATTVGASILFTIPRLENPIRVFAVQYIKSYGEKLGRFCGHV
jgi:hypothetical protein